MKPKGVLQNSLCLLLLCSHFIGAQDAVPPSASSDLQYNYTTQALSIADTLSPCKSTAQYVPVVEATISTVQEALKNGTLTCTQLVETFVQRITQFEALYNIRAVRVIVPTWQNESATLDATLPKIRSGDKEMPKLFCVPMLIKDNIDVVGASTTNGAVGLRDNLPSQDAHQVALLKEAGAIMLAKTNMAEWAFLPDISIGSEFGVVRNPYDLDRSTAGSSGGTAAGVAASFALAGMGTDTGNSIRGPAGWNSLVGIRPSLGLSSRAGVIPLDITSDVAGPIARTVEDAVRIFEATVGVDPADNLTTLQSSDAVPSNYTQFLQKDGLRGVKVGVMRQTIQDSADPDVMDLFQAALMDLNDAGATIVDNFTIDGNSLGAEPWRGDNTWYTGNDSTGKYEQLDCGARFRADVNQYLSTANTTYNAIEDIVEAGLIHPSVNASMHTRLDIPYLPEDYPPPQLLSLGYLCNCQQFYDNPCRSEFRKRLIASMDAEDVSVIVFPTWSNLPALIGDYGAPDGNNSPQISPPTGAPSMTVPMGFAAPTDGGYPLPASLQFLARPFDEANMIRAAYAYEQATLHRRTPSLFPECSLVEVSSPSPAHGITNSHFPAGDGVLSSLG